jgi:hypothetical protein
MKNRNVQPYYVIMQQVLKAQIHIQLRPSIKYGFHYANFHETHTRHWTSPVANFTSNRTKNVESMWERSYTPLSTLWLEVRRFSCNSQLLGAIT